MWIVKYSYCVPICPWKQDCTHQPPTLVWQTPQKGRRKHALWESKAQLWDAFTLLLSSISCTIYHLCSFWQEHEDGNYRSVTVQHTVHTYNCQYVFMKVSEVYTRSHSKNANTLLTIKWWYFQKRGRREVILRLDNYLTNSSLLRRC